MCSIVPALIELSLVADDTIDFYGARPRRFSGFDRKKDVYQHFHEDRHCHKYVWEEGEEEAVVVVSFIPPDPPVTRFTSGHVDLIRDRRREQLRIPERRLNKTIVRSFFFAIDVSRNYRKTFVASFHQVNISINFVNRVGEKNVLTAIAALMEWGGRKKN